MFIFLVIRSLKKMIMNNISNIHDKKNKKRSVIIGGGFAGLTIAKKIYSKKFQVGRVDQNNNHKFKPLVKHV